MITGKAKIAGVVGWPVTHSLSPVLQGYWLEELGIDGAMVPLATHREDFARVIDGARRAGFRGVNVTVPHKEAAFSLAHRNDALAVAAGAANLLVFTDTGIEGRNTDAIGLAESLRENIGELNGKRVVLLGAGGAARGAVLALEMLGAGAIHLLNRDVHRAKTLAASFSPKAKLLPGALADWAGVAGDAVLVVNSTSAGMGNIPPLDIDLGALPKGAAVCDIVYSPLETALLKDAAARGHKTIDGLGMLMHQAVPSFEAFFGVKPKVTQGLRDALVKVLRDRV
ncbi:MAG: Shikimate dehydrogenase [Alphaproteobacteria bacterium]|nr:Shikimate dehydrogenase [Alphaproteobacteria bacterium]MDB5739328.1 Shikimate dehydrogenase [Alphaproteobacteria bacterium]